MNNRFQRVWRNTGLSAVLVCLLSFIALPSGADIVDDFSNPDVKLRFASVYTGKDNNKTSTALKPPFSLMLVCATGSFFGAPQVSWSRTLNCSADRPCNLIISRRSIENVREGSCGGWLLTHGRDKNVAYTIAGFSQLQSTATATRSLMPEGYYPLMNQAVNGIAEQALDVHIFPNGDHLQATP
ncbi:hypothetical protein [Parendozoicomonas haliclonae]|uniref:Uncharacterized protein n=1 Tax=Parendozoicomonas haliclonae TaxID=1960125 RepID=A0A1X7AG26_9GAMM|nr:hypothetical protein [Parendozoicomonas haliclonae]SMA37607.1 hypothetical protein EHSB41UT_00767 [Parendozoicomonas haliclonae]